DRYENISYIISGDIDTETNHKKGVMKMKKEIMKRAWEISRQGAEKFGGKAIEYIAEALKIAWNEVKTIMKIENEKIKVKYNEWKKYGKHRIYMDIEMSLVEIKNVKGNEV